MIKQVLKVPKDVEFISLWKDYAIPTGHCIVDKGVTGCGYTEMCLRNDLNVILCSPRKLLLKNKKQQHLADTNILYLENEGAGWEKEKERIENENSDVDGIEFVSAMHLGPRAIAIGKNNYNILICRSVIDLKYTFETNLITL